MLLHFVQRKSSHRLVTAEGRWQAPGRTWRRLSYVSRQTMTNGVSFRLRPSSSCLAHLTSHLDSLPILIQGWHSCCRLSVVSSQQLRLWATHQRNPGDDWVHHPSYQCTAPMTFHLFCLHHCPPPCLLRDTRQIASLGHYHLSQSVPDFPVNSLARNACLNSRQCDCCRVGHGLSTLYSSPLTPACTFMMIVYNLHVCGALLYTLTGFRNTIFIDTKFNP